MKNSCSGSAAAAAGGGVTWRDTAEKHTRTLVVHTKKPFVIQFFWFDEGHFMLFVFPSVVVFMFWWRFTVFKNPTASILIYFCRHRCSHLSNQVGAGENFKLHRCKYETKTMKKKNTAESEETGTSWWNQKFAIYQNSKITTTHTETLTRSCTQTQRRNKNEPWEVSCTHTHTRTHTLSWVQAEANNSCGLLRDKQIKGQKPLLALTQMQHTHTHTHTYSLQTAAEFVCVWLCVIVCVCDCVCVWISSA